MWKLLDDCKTDCETDGSFHSTNTSTAAAIVALDARQQLDTAPRKLLLYFNSFIYFCGGVAFQPLSAVHICHLHNPPQAQVIICVIQRSLL